MVIMLLTKALLFMNIGNRSKAFDTLRFLQDIILYLKKTAGSSQECLQPFLGFPQVSTTVYVATYNFRTK